jgi:GNAT superfamily N-acetyltransferase
MTSRPSVTANSNQPLRAVKQIDVTITYLDMLRPPDRPPPLRPSESVRVARLEKPTVSYYRWLYDAVGSKWLWFERKRLSDDAVRAVIEDPLLQIWVLSVGHVPAGFFEIDARTAPASTNIAYFGLTGDFIGKGLGKFFLDCAIVAAWATGPKRVTVNTCTLDHPRALGLYQAAGFQIIERRHRRILDPRINPGIRRSASRTTLEAPRRPAIETSGSGSG